jgi:phage-related protein
MRLDLIPNTEYNRGMDASPKRAVWLRGSVRTPPFTVEGRREMGGLIRDLQNGESLGMPASRPMPSIGPRCHELRVGDADHNWRLIYRIDPDAIIVVDVFPKTTRTTPKPIIDGCQERLKRYDKA